MSNKVIVFGPTGGVASFAAITAQQQGAKVFLAMRDTSKTIPGLSSSEEKSGGYERLQADLTKPDTVSAVVKQSGATSAFIYVAHGTPDHLKATITALKDSGIKLVVFLSSSSISERDPKSITPDDIIPFVHAQVEIHLEDVFGSTGYVALRPGSFATNPFNWWGHGIKSGEVKLYGPKIRSDFITPDDMGRTAGHILAAGQQKNGEKYVYLFGPQKVAHGDAFHILNEKVWKPNGKNVKLTITESEEEALQLHLATGHAPPPIAKYLVRMTAKLIAEEKDIAPEGKIYDEGVANVEKYTGKKAQGWEDWVEANKEKYAP